MNNREYWRERMRALEEKGYRESEAYYEELKKKFTSANNQIQMDIDRWYHRLAENNNISYASAAKFLNKSELEEFQWSVWEYIRKGKENALNQEWMKELENASANVHISYLQSMKIQLQQHAEELYTQYEKGMTQLLTNRYTNGFYETAYEIAKGTGVGVNLSQLNTRQIDIVLTTPWAQDGKIFSDRIWENKEKLVRELNTELTQCIIRGEHPDRAAARLAKTMGVKRTQAKTLVQTEAAAITMKAQQSCFKELEIEEYEIEETLDSFTCSFCGEMDGKHFTMSEYEVGVTAPPFHPRCRGCTCPYFHDEFTVNEKRGARKENGDTYDVPADMTYKEWKKKYVGQDVEIKDRDSIKPDIKFSTKPGLDINAKEKLNDMMIVSSVFDELPEKVKQNFRNVTFEFGYEGSSCDILNKTIRVAVGAEKEDIFHEFGHLIENYMMNQEAVEKYKKYLVDGLTIDDIIIETYYDTKGNAFDIFLLKGKRFESEYQSRLYALNLNDIVNLDGTINTDLLGETISEIFRKYMNHESISIEAKKLIEGVIL